MMENPFKDAQIVAVDANDATPDLVYIDDDIQIELRHENLTRSSTPCNGDSENENPMSIKVDPIEEQMDEDTDTPDLPDIFRTCILESSLDIKNEPEENFDCTIEDEEQFEIVEDVEKNNSSSTNDSTRANKSNESNDHSYSQPPVTEAENSKNTRCDDMINNILQDTNFNKNQDALKLLKEYTKCIENFIFFDVDNGRASMLLKEVMQSLENNEKAILDELPVDEPKTTETAENHVEEINNTSIADENENEKNNLECLKKSESSEDLSMKLEAIEHDTGTTKQTNKDENDDIEAQMKNNEKEAEKLKVYVKKALEKTADFSERNQKLLESVFVTDEDIENGNSKFKTSLNEFITFNVTLLMDVEEQTDRVTVADEIRNITERIKSRRAARNILNIESSSSDEKLVKSSNEELPSTSNGIGKNSPSSRKSSISKESKDSSDSDSDNSINRLTNLSTLNQKSRKYDKQESQAPAKKTLQKAKKKSKENSDDSSLDSNISSSESESEDVTKTINNIVEKNEESEDEELKLKHKLEMKARNNLLASSDDEESYVTSETSDFSTDDEKKDEEKASKKKASKKTTSSSESDEKEDAVKSKEILSIKAEVKNGAQITDENNEIADIEPVVSNGDVKKDRKRARVTSFDREIFDKKLLDDSEDEKESDTSESKPNRSKKSRRNSRKSTEDLNDSDVVDLTRPVNIQADRIAPTLERYLEKLASTAVDDLVNADELLSTPKAESLKKNDQQKSSKVPSPTIDDIDCISISSESDSEISSTVSEGQTRRRKQLTEEELKEETKKAKKDEAERIKRLEAKEQRMSDYLTQRLSQNDIIATDELVLDYSEEKNLTIEVHSGLVGKLKNHQVDGIKFMYNNCYGSVDETKENNGSGCILAHCMGLGKTLQLIVLLHTVFRYPELHTKRVLIICPKSTIHNWAEEFRKWLQGIEGKPVVIYLEDNLKIERRIEKLRDWFESRRPSVFLINYESFRTLANWSGSHQRSKISIPEETIKKYKQQIAKYLLEPGPHLVVCDEGHIIKNQKGATNRAITKITTKRRIILTGTPVQNALHEYYAMVEWIKPNILGTIHEFNNIYANPIKDGQNKDSSDYQIKKMKQKSYVLNKNLSKFVQRKDAQVLKEFLPKKYEYCISVPLTEVQEKLYNTFLQANRSDDMGRSLLPIYTALRKIWTHPMVLQYAYDRAKRGENKFGATNQLKEKEKKSQNVFNEDEGDEPDDIFDTSQGTTAVTNNWWKDLLSDREMFSLTSSHKMILLFEILRLCEIKKEKILIFSSFVAVLDIIERFMKAIHNQDNNPNAKLYGFDKYKTTWEVGKDYYRLDGSTPRNVRQEMINAFNNTQSPRLRCFLISAKAGGQGINLVAANRCIIVDTSWNPANDNQNIFRIFRLGQKKTCYVYRLVACSTMEERVYSRSVTKEAMSHRVVEKKQIDRHYVRTELEELFVPYELKPQDKTPNFPVDDILRYLLSAHPKSAYTFHEHDSLLENKPDQELNEDEKNEAWNSYLAELQGNRYQMQNMNNSNMNLNAQGLGVFGKTPMSADFLKLYNDMLGPSTSNYAQLMGMLPSTSLTGLDTLGLSSPYFPMSSSFYNSDLLKRFGNFDPLNIYSSSTSLPTPSSTTSNTSSLMQSVLRNSPNPISALGNMTVAAATSAAPTSSYNANNIPPATNSIFAQPATTNYLTASSSNQTLMPNLSKYPSTSGLTSAVVAKKKAIVNMKKSSQIKNLPSVMKDKYITSKSPIAPPRPRDPLPIPPNSSENLSILPDNDSTTTPLQLNKSIAGTSARTLQVPHKRVVASSNFAKDAGLDKMSRSLIRQNVSITSANGSKSIQGTVHRVVGPSPTAAKQQAPTVIQKTQAPTIQRVQSMAQPVGSNVIKSSSFFINNSKPSIQQGNSSKAATSQLIVSPMMKVANKPLAAPVQKRQSAQVLNLSSTSGNDSVSIIKLPTKSNMQSQPTSSVILTPTTSSATLQKPVSYIKAAQPANAKNQVHSNIIRGIQQQNKRVIDNQTSLALKRLKLNESMNITQSTSPQSQQISQARVVQPVLTQRSNLNQSVMRNSQINRQSSQQPNNKKLPQNPTEVVELE